MPGFLFDMNIFFQRLLFRFLRENLASARIADELAIRNLFTYAPDANPRQRRAPAPRPDYALFYDKVLHGFWTQNIATFGNGAFLPSGCISSRYTHLPRPAKLACCCMPECLRKHVTSVWKSANL